MAEASGKSGGNRQQGTACFGKSVETFQCFGNASTDIDNPPVGTQDKHPRNVRAQTYSKPHHSYHENTSNIMSSATESTVPCASDCCMLRALLLTACTGHPRTKSTRKRQKGLRRLQNPPRCGVHRPQFYRHRPLSPRIYPEGTFGV